MLIKKMTLKSRIFLRGLGAMPALLFLAAIVLTPPAAAQATGGGVSLGYIPGSSHKLYQINGDCDWVQWDATIGNATPTCNPTVSQTATKADVLGDDVPVAFEHNGELIVTFGDTIGAAGYSAWTNVQNSFLWGAHDPIARSTTTSAADGLLLNFFLNGTHGLEVLPPPQPDGTAVDMGVDNVPHAGVSLNGTIYLGIKTGNVSLGDGNNDQSHDYSVLATFDETTETFTSGRTISTLPNGHFVGPTFYLAPAGVLGTPPPVSPEPVMLIFGVGAFRASNVYLSIIPSTEFASGVDQDGNSATRYFSGMSNGQPTWSSSESSAVPIVTDLDPANPTISNASVFYSQPLGLWLMVYDGGRGSISTEGMYFTYAPQPWGPWSTPQLVFNGCRDKGLGNFIFYYYAIAAQNDCPSAMPAGVTSAPNSAGPAGPTIGDQTVNDPTTTRGDAYAPTFVERFTIISGSTLQLFYMFATWNPYAVVMMESDFNITQINLRTPTSPVPTSSPTPSDTTPTASATPTKTPASTLTFTLTPTFSTDVTPMPSLTATSTVTPAPIPTATPMPCAGDCNHNGQVTVDEILTMVNIALGNTPVTACEAGDANHDGQITVDEILAAVNEALNRCPPPTSIVSISVCTTGSGSPGSCPSGSFDTHQIVLAPDGSGNAINSYNGMVGISDEHQSIFAPGALQTNNDYLFFVASRVEGGAPSTGVVVLSGGSGPDKNGQWTLDFPKTDGYGSYGSGYGTIFVAPTGPNCPTVADGNPAHQDSTFDLTYAAPGSLVVDPTSPPGNLLMVYEGTNTCFGITGGSNNGNNFYSSVGIATSRDFGRTWPTYRGKSGFSFVQLPGQNSSQGPGATTGALGSSVCIGNDCTTTPSANYGRYPVLSPSVSIGTAMALGTSIPSSMGDSEMSAFVDDAGANPAQYIYAVYDYKAGTGVLTDPNASNTGLMIARAQLNGGTAPLSFLKWNGHAFTSAGMGGYDTPIFPAGSFSNCEGPSQLRYGASISYVDATQQYLLTFVCDSPGDPALGQVAGAPRGGAWFYSTSYSLSDPTQWTPPQEITGSWTPFDESGGCSSYKGFYPTLMSLGAKTGHLSTTGYVFYLYGCQTDNTPPPGRQYSSRAFTISTNQ
ncbi:MAG: DUF4185 domain-containing protein [Candidatus Binatia bacterium]|jgi:hypothetical protein